MQSIRICDLTKSFGDTRVLDQLSVTIPAGRVSALMAPSGAGKTTLLRILMGLEQPDGGQISGLENLRLSAVFQEDRLCENLSPVSNIRLVTGNSLSRRSILESLDSLGILSCAARPVRSLSGGQLRRVALARALLAPWDLLLLDEPFKGLDDQTRRQAMDYVLSFLTPERIILLVTHDYREAESMASRIFQLPSAVKSSAAQYSAAQYNAAQSSGTQSDV